MENNNKKREGVGGGYKKKEAAYHEKRGIFFRAPSKKTVRNTLREKLPVSVQRYFF